MVDTAAVNMTHQTLFRSEYELEMENWLRRRFRAVSICYVVLTLVHLLIWLPILTFSNRDGESTGRATAIFVTVAAAVAALAVNAHFLIGRKWERATRLELLRAASQLIMLLGIISLCKVFVLKLATSSYNADFILPLLGWHFIACCFLPWTPRESLKPIIPLMAVWALSALLLRDDSIGSRIGSVLAAPLVLIPGLAICSIRLQYHGEQFRTRMIGKHFLTMRQELSQARTIHESMFPKPHDDGFVRFEYTYTPMRELGGDFIHFNVSPEGLVHLTILDVTGHGLAAALTVNRLYGEIDRIRAECPQAEPGEILTLLNRYIHLTMARHTIFVTAASMTIDPYLSKLHWANAGHPPAFVRGANGAVTQLPATTVLLGAMDSSEFTADQKTMELSPGDVIVAYTDGAFEARDRVGEWLGIDRLEHMMRSHPAPRQWPPYISSAVQKHTGGRTDDDILIAAITYCASRQQPVFETPQLAAT